MSSTWGRCFLGDLYMAGVIFCGSYGSVDIGSSSDARPRRSHRERIDYRASITQGCEADDEGIICRAGETLRVGLIVAWPALLFGWTRVHRRPAARAA